MQPFHLRGFSVLPVTIPAELRYVCPVYWGGVVVFGLGFMGAMTIGTVRSILYVCIVGLAMTASKIVIENLCMAGRAVYRFIGGTGPLHVFGDSRMAFGALDILVHGIGQYPAIHKE
jgi:hypothetical protein